MSDDNLRGGATEWGSVRQVRRSYRVGRSDRVETGRGEDSWRVHCSGTACLLLVSLTVRRWHGQMSRKGKGQVITAKAYRLLRTILNTAVEDGLIPANPCRLNGAGVERSPERPVLEVGQVFQLAEAIGDRWRALVLLATFAHLRWGELAALRRHCLDLGARIVQVRASQSEVGSELILGPPKSRAGDRTVTFPAVIVPAPQHHLDAYAQPGRIGLVFVGEKGGPLRRCNFSGRWAAALDAVGLDDGVHFTTCDTAATRGRHGLEPTCRS